MQDQQKQTRDQHNGSYPCYREYQCLRRGMVTYILALHGQVRSKKTGVRPDPEREHALNADYRMQLDDAIRLTDCS
jgi:hypothetical protein